ncbi:MAG: hypothetical protein FWG45_05545 [Oscillospiraceae bacterium]|nr:hypothetical protein [Oscillospiraceae bacterium]
MTVINVIGKASDKALGEIILSQLSNSYRVTYIKSKSLVQEGNGYEIVVADFTELKSLYAPECFIVLKNGGAVPRIPLPEKTIIVVNSENIDQLNALRGVGCTVITCGASVKDTLSCSSYGFADDDNSVMVSLNREVTAFSGRKIQPLEIPLKLPKLPKDVYYAIAFTAIRLILDDFNSELGALI